MRALKVFSVLLLLPASLSAQAWDPFPNLPAGEHLAIASSLDGPAYDTLRNCLRNFDSTYGTEFYAGIVGVTSADGSPSPSRSDAVPYVDALYQAWIPTGRLDADRHVLIALGLENRAIAVHPGRRWADLGFEGDAIRRIIDGSSFGAYARSGDYGLAICDLALAIDNHLESLANAEASQTSSVPAGGLRGPEEATVSARPSSNGSSGGGALWLLLPLGGAGALGWARASKGRRARERATEELARWKEKIEVAAERVLAIETEHPLYFATSAERWSGESQALDHEAADAVNYVFLLYSKAYEIHQRANDLVERAKGGALASPAPFDEAFQLLRETEVTIQTGEVEDRRRIFLPLRKEYRGSSAHLLDDLGSAYGAAYDKLREVIDVAEKAIAQAEEAGRVAAEALEEAQRRGELGLPVEHLQAALDPWLEQRREADALVATDPIAASTRLEEASLALAGLIERAQAGNSAIEAVRGPILELGTSLRAEVERLRADGFALAEPGFDPDLRLDRGVDEAHRIEALLAEGDEPQATRLRQTLEEGLEELKAQLTASEAARDGVPEQLESLVNSSRELSERSPGAEATLASLEKEHALESFRDEADNLQELQTLLGRLDEWFEHIREDHREQRYLSATADLESVEALIAEGVGLLDAIDAIEKRLAAARDGARELAYQCQQQLGRLDQLATGLAGGIGTELRRQMADLEGRTSASLEEAGGERPRWLELETALGASAKELELTVAQVEEELEAFARAKRLAPDLRTRLAQLEREVTSETRDRQHVAHAVDDVSRQLTAWSSRLKEPEFSGSELERQGRELTAAFDQARGAFEAEMDLVRLAEARRRTAESLLRQVDGRNFGHGIIAECRAGRHSLRRIDEAWQRKDWEAALSLADEARATIEAEQQRCRDRAHQLELEARRRLAAQREAERRAQMRRTAPTISPSLGRPRLGRTIGSSRTSFGSRMGRRSGGSSFGRSRSGGSSW